MYPMAFKNPRPKSVGKTSYPANLAQCTIFASCLAILLSSVTSVALADSKKHIISSYSMEEIYERAFALKKILSKDFPSDNIALIDLSTKAAEFHGYVAGTIDQQELDDKDLVECTHQNTVTAIAGRAAAVLSSIPLDRSKPPGLGVLLAIHYACQDLREKVR